MIIKRFKIVKGHYLKITLLANSRVFSNSTDNDSQQFASSDAMTHDEDDAEINVVDLSDPEDGGDAVMAAVAEPTTHPRCKCSRSYNKRDGQWRKGEPSVVEAL